MRKFVLLGSLLTLLAFLALVIAFSAQAVSPNRPHPRVKKVTVVNLPPTQEVAGAVEVTNLPPVQDVFVTNPPACEGGGAASRFQLVGYTQAKVSIPTNLFALNRACYAEFPDSRLCSVAEIQETVNTDSVIGLANGPAWVRAGPSESVQIGNNLNCQQWTSVNTQSVVVGENGNFQYPFCWDNNAGGPLAQSVSCCALRP